MKEHNAQIEIKEEATNVKGIVFGIVGFAISIFALFMSFMVFLSSLSGAVFAPLCCAPLPVLALVFCGIAKRNGFQSKMVLLGNIFGIISTCIWCVAFAISIYNMAVYGIFLY